MELFKKISKDKQDRIINAGFVCFGKNGYKRTSMGNIAEYADISKASLFQYFGSKKDFYLYLYQFGCDLLIASAIEMPSSDDFFESQIASAS